MLKKIIVTIGLVCALASTSCTDEEGSRRALNGMGFKDITFTGYKMWGCSDSDSFTTGFIATNPTGGRVEGVVCCGWMKNCTVRF